MTLTNAVLVINVRCDKQRRDYLNESQICSACYKQIERTIPSGFKPNHKFENCKRRRQGRDHLNEFQICSLCYN